MPNFATYLHAQTCLTSKPVAQIQFIGHSLPYFSRVRQALAEALSGYPALPVRKVALEEYGRVHATGYLQKLARMAAGEVVEDRPKLSIECVGLHHSLPGHRYGFGGMVEAIDRMKAGSLERAYCFTLGGHHAHPDWGHGYCMLNPQAAAARYAQEQGFQKVLIVDWDLHHGDGTQAIFAHDPTVYCISIHSVADLYMAVAHGMRYATTTRGKEVGHCNIPILNQAYGDDFFEKLNLGGEFYRAQQSLPAFQWALDQLPWTPDFILIFSGYDGHRDDQGKGIMDWTNDDYRQLTRLVLDVAQKAGCPVLSQHGGGYTLPVAVSAAVSHAAMLAT